ncbi:MAG TPA: glycosyltransferase family 4 protein [Terracidiphilus sp.]|nr:glycosyltransferase family 4 protein [Terracidiphilus sp.]
MIPQFSLGSGGHHNIFSAIAELEKMGHTNRVYLVSGGQADAQLSTDVARRYYAPIQCRIEPFDGAMPDSDALVATSWETAYRVRTVGNTSRRFYFAQDLEYQFFPEGSLREFAAETYRWGFFGITGGEWIADTLSREFGMKCLPFHFWYDAALYRPVPKAATSRKRVLFYARPRTPRRGFELGLLTLACVAEKVKDVEFVLAGMTASDIKLPFRADFPGVLPIEKLPDLYSSVTAALVLSHTNVSLLPIELMACGCPVVSNRGPNVAWQLSDENCRMADPIPECLADQLVLLLKDDELRAACVEAGLRFAQKADRKREIEKIERAFRAGLTR